MKTKLIFLITLILANILLYLTPLTQSREVNNFRLGPIDAATTYGAWHLEKDIGATEVEITGLPGSTIVRKSYRNDKGQEIQFVIIANNFRSSIHSPTDCLPAQGWVIDRMDVERNTIARDAVPVNTIMSRINTKEGTRRELVWYWYAVYGHNFSSHFRAVVYNSIQRTLFGRKYYWALIRLTTPITAAGEPAAAEALQDFLRQSYPTIKQIKDTI